MSLLRELQSLTERTYRLTSGINLEEFVIGRRRFADLSSRSAADALELSEAARVFFRRSGEALYLAMYFSEEVISHLERNDPRRGLNERNIEAFMVFIEEINHGVHGVVKFLRGETAVGEEIFVRDLELMAKIDAYQTLKFFLAYFNPSRRLENFDRMWIRYHLFERSRFDYASPRLSRRYAEANLLGEKYTRYLDGMSPESRLAEMRRFQKMKYPAKAAYIRLLP